VTYINSYHENPDLLLRFSQGQQNAFATVYDMFYDRVYGFAKRWLNDSRDIEDITADTFLKLWDRRDTFQSIDNIGAFLYITVRNSCFNLLKHKQIKNDRHEDIRRTIEESNEIDFANMEIRAEFLKLVYAEVEKMPAKMKAIFLLSYRDGLKPAEIAEKLELSVQTIKNQKVNSIKLLRIAFTNNSLLLAFLLYLKIHSSGMAVCQA
jgi:RNA polymerase sigma-70 factor (ECF subfamily)